MTHLNQSRFMKALRCCNDEVPPVWLMRQAGRYLPEYRALRSRHSFNTMTHQPDLIAQVTLQPIQRFHFDAAILFSDILTLTEAMGYPFDFIEGRGPVLASPMRSANDVAHLPNPDIRTLHFVAEGIQLLKRELKVPLIGFCGGPFTVASYLIEGGTSRDFRKTKSWMVRDPESFHTLLSYLANLSVQYLQMQIAAGVDAVQIFDSWANVLAYPQFREFSLSYLQRIRSQISVPLIVFCRGSSVFAEALADIQPAAIGIDWNGDLRQIRHRLGPRPALQGNLDPDLLLGSVESVKRQALNMIEGMGNDPGYIVNLGHGVIPETPLESVQAILDVVRGAPVRSGR